MKRISLIPPSAAILWVALSASVSAQTTDNSILYTPNVNLSSGPQNGFAGTVGGIFLTTYSFYPQVNWLGYYDQNGDGLANSHLVTLWDNSTQGIIATALVPAGTVAPLVNGYRWAQLPSTLDDIPVNVRVVGTIRALACGGSNPKSTYPLPVPLGTSGGNALLL